MKFIKTHYRFSSWVLISIILFILLPFVLKAQFGGGSGTSGDPYLISNQTHLENISTSLTSYYKQVSHISMSGSWTPIGNDTESFSGYYDGDSYTISGFTPNWIPSNSSDDVIYVGLFGKVSGTITNTYLINISFSGDWNTTKYFRASQIYSGLLVGKTTSTATITNNFVQNSSATLYYDFRSYEGTTAAYHYWGQMVGYSEGTLSNNYSVSCTTSVQVRLTSSGGVASPTIQLNVSGLYGYASGTIQKSSVVDSKVSANFFSYDGGSSSVTHISGLLARMGSSSSLLNSYVTGTWIDYEGGTSTTSDINISGLVGYISGSVQYCYTVLSGGNANSVHDYYYFSASTGTLTSCLYNGDDVGVPNFWKTTTGVTSATKSQLKSSAFYLSYSYNFSSIWNINANYNYGYAILQNQDYLSTPPSPQSFDLVYPLDGSIGISVNVNLEWNQSLNASNYFYYVYKTSNSQLFIQGYTANTSIIVSGLSGSTQYSWTITAYNAQGSYQSDTSSFTTAFSGQYGLESPTINKPQNDTTGLVTPYTLTWTSVSGATDYDYEFEYPEYNNYTALSGVTGGSTSLLLNSAMKGMLHRFKVRATNVTDSSNWAESLFRTQYAVPDTVVRISPLDSSTNFIPNFPSGVFEWYLNDSSVTSYQLQVVDTVGGSDTDIENVFITAPDTNKVSDGNYIVNRWYKWRMRAINPSDTSAWNEYWWFKVKSANPSNPITPLQPIVETNCLGGQGGILTNPISYSIDWNWMRFENSNSILNFNLTMFDDTLYTSLNPASSKDVNLFPKDSIGFFADISNGTWLTNNPQWWKENSYWNYITDTKKSSATNWYDNFAAPKGNYMKVFSDSQDQDSLFFGFGLGIVSLKWRFEIITYDETDGSNTVSVSPTTGDYGLWIGNLMHEPFLYDDSLFIWGVLDGGSYNNDSTWINTRYITWDWKNNVWKTGKIKNYVESRMGASPPFGGDFEIYNIDVPVGMWQIDTAFYMITQDVEGIQGDGQRILRLWEINTNGWSKILSGNDFSLNRYLNDDSVYVESGQDEISLIYTDTLYHNFVDGYFIPTDCWLYWSSWDTYNSDLQLFKFDGASVTQITEPNTVLDLSSVYVSESGTNIFWVYQDFSIKNGGSSPKGYRSHALTSVVDTFNVPFSSETVSNIDSVGFFNDMYFYEPDSLLYLYRDINMSGWGSYGWTSGGEYTNYIWFTDFSKSKRNYIPPIGKVNEIRGARPRAVNLAKPPYGN